MHQQNDDLTEHETRMWEHYKKIEAENYSLKNQLKNKNAIIKDWQKSYSALNKKYKLLLNNRKPRFRNNGKKKIK